ncbi:hypothetical protein Zmor_009087 [Zophobas morio]|uniref:Uncharacterized protein n=1 Tax=Zophobas morio TaxID=2755281 RepID=A0AA38IKY1_9CUCU|nr:hypothetical protein Zmor_009087 [Zophobas morio]
MGIDCLNCAKDTSITALPTVNRVRRFDVNPHDSTRSTRPWSGGTVPSPRPPSIRSITATLAQLAAVSRVEHLRRAAGVREEYPRHKHSENSECPSSRK